MEALQPSLGSEYDDMAKVHPFNADIIIAENYALNRTEEGATTDRVREGRLGSVVTQARDTGLGYGFRSFFFLGRTLQDPYGTVRELYTGKDHRTADCVLMIHHRSMQVKDCTQRVLW